MLSARGTGGVAVNGYRGRIALLITATVLVMVNALAFWGDDAASRFDRILQVCTAAVAIADRIVAT